MPVTFPATSSIMSANLVIAEAGEVGIQQGCQATDLTYSGSPRTVMEWSGLMTLANFVATMYLSRLPPFSALAAGSQYHLVSRVMSLQHPKAEVWSGKSRSSITLAGE